MKVMIVMAAMAILVNMVVNLFPPRRGHRFTLGSFLFFLGVRELFLGFCFCSDLAVLDSVGLGVAFRVTVAAAPFACLSFLARGASPGFPLQAVVGRWQKTHVPSGGPPCLHSLPSCHFLQISECQSSQALPFLHLPMR